MKQNENKDRLKELFRQIPQEEVTPSFELNTMARIQQEAILMQKKKKSRSVLFQIFWIATGIIALLGIPALILGLLDINITVPSYSPYIISLITKSLQSIHIDPITGTIGFSVLCLLSVNLLIRKFIHKKQQSQNGMYIES